MTALSITAKFLLIIGLLSNVPLHSVESKIFNPLELYIGAKEGCALYNNENGKKNFLLMLYYDLFHNIRLLEFACHLDTTKLGDCGIIPEDECCKKGFNQIEVLSNNGNEFRLKYK